MHECTTKHIGLDDHKDTISVGVAAEGVGEPAYFGRIENRPEAVRRLIAKLSSDDSTLICWYEAGPCGYGLYRQINQLGQRCHVCAPSLTRRRSGVRVKTDRRDCLELARQGRSGDLTPVWVPSPADEAMRSLSRLREDAMLVRRRARQRLKSFLLRHGCRYDAGRSSWTGMYFRWLDTLRFDEPLDQRVFGHYVQAVIAASRQLEAAEVELTTAVSDWRLGCVVDGYMALRGVNVIAATSLTAELGDLRRFDHPRQLMAFVGLTPEIDGSGLRTRRGPITKAGNVHARRMLIEAAWCYRHPAKRSEHLRRKAARAPEPVQAIAWKAQTRLCGRYRRLLARGKLKTQICAAVARELTGFLWAIAEDVWPAEVGELQGESSATL